MLNSQQGRPAGIGPFPSDGRCVRAPLPTRISSGMCRTLQPMGLARTQSSAAATSPSLPIPPAIHGRRATPSSEPLFPRERTSTVSPVVDAPMARPAEQLDVGAPLVPEARVGPVMHRHRSAAVQPHATAAALTTSVTRRVPQPAPPPPNRRADVGPIEQRLPTSTAHAARTAHASAQNRALSRASDLSPPFRSNA